jgi:hypothetical protein
LQLQQRVLHPVAVEGREEARKEEEGDEREGRRRGEEEERRCRRLGRLKP